MDPEQEKLLKMIEDLIKKQLPIKELTLQEQVVADMAWIQNTTLLTHKERIKTQEDLNVYADETQNNDAISQKNFQKYMISLMEKHANQKK